MFDIGFGEMLVLAAIALIAIGPKQLPEVARTVGRMLNEFKRATGDLTKSFTDQRNYVDDVRPEVIPPAHDHVSDHTPEHPHDPIHHHPVVTPSAAEEQLSFTIQDSETKKG
ncbi:MAG: twin-arginine translocase TatA/TatE family subunit [Bdellovibrionota bacterium]